MKNKSHRLTRIREIIHNQAINSQEQLLQLLEKEGFITTQATLSRDLKYLGAGRISDGRGGYRYFMASPSEKNSEGRSGMMSPGHALLSLEFARDLLLIFSLPGYASMIAITIDQSVQPEIAGTVAGDDTILVIPRDGVTKRRVKSALTEIFPEATDVIYKEST